MKHKILNIAHRGASGIAPENTLPAFYKAIECGADMIELDIHLSADKHPVIIHDDSIKKYTGEDISIKRLELAYLKSLDFGKWFSEGFSGERILTLGELFETLGKKIKMDLEIKGDEYYYRGIVEKVLAIIEKYMMSDHVVISSFNLKLLKKVSEGNQAIPLGLIFNKDEWGYMLKSAEKLRCKFIVPDIKITSEERINSAHSLGISVYPYGVDTEEELRRVATIGVDGIITNRPDILSKILYEDLERKRS